jgi:glycosyltransferase involved in cell wall biosynthesis
VVVDSSDDGTEEIVAQEFPEVRLLHQPERTTTGKARNIGVRETEAPVVLFLDTDCIAPPGWIAGMLDALWERGAEAVCGSLENGTPWSISGSVGFYLEFFRFLSHRGANEECAFLVGGNSGFKRGALQAVPYEDLNIGDDFWFSTQLKQRGYVLLFLPSVPVRHLNKTGWSTVLGYQYKLGLGACRYRRRLSPRIMQVLQKLPLLAFLVPNAVMIWIGAVVLQKRGLLEFLKFVALVPAAYVANIVWAAGFYRALRSHGL